MGGREENSECRLVFKSLLENWFSKAKGPGSFLFYFT